MEDNVEDNTVSHFTSETRVDKLLKDVVVNSEDINAAIAMTDDGKTIILCDYKFVNPPLLVALDMASSYIHISGGDFGKPGVRLQYPLEYDKINIWKKEEMTYFAYVDDEGAHDTYEIPILFIS